MANSRIRIIGGQWRGRKIGFDAHTGLRPTADKIRETVFNWLQQDITDSRCLDCFAGSGAMGFEALSRGAREVVMLENNPAVIRTLKAAALTLAAKNLIIKRQDSTKYIQREQPAYDILFLDPPFSMPNLDSFLENLAKSPLLHAHSLIYLESARKITLKIPTQWTALKSQTAGNVRFELYKIGGSSDYSI